MLAAAAASTTTLRLGTLVTSPNFRHPAVLAKDAMTLDQISAGRFDLGIGAGGVGFDSEVLGQPVLTPAERSERFAEFVETLDELLRNPATSHEGAYYGPRIPDVSRMCTAAPCSLHHRRRRAEGDAPGCTIRTDVGHLRPAQTAHRRCRLVRPGSAGRCNESTRSVSNWAGSEIAAAHGSGGSRAALGAVSVDAWDEFQGSVEEMGFTDIAIHWPRPSDPGCLVRRRLCSMRSAVA